MDWTALVIWPPQVLSYFNAGHHAPLYGVAAYLRSRPEFTEVDTIDGSVEHLTWKEIGDRVHQKRYDLIAIMNDFDGVDGLPRLISYVRELSPGSRLVTFGRLSGIQPELFRKFDLDGVVGAGDYEAGVYDFAAAACGGRSPSALPGVHLKAGPQWLPPCGPGRTLPADEWVLPDVAEIPYDRYDWFYRDDRNKFCGIPQRRELIVPAARGCPVACAYCEVPAVFGRPDRRLSVPRVVEYIESSFARLPFEYVSFYAPTLTLDRAWTRRLCEELISRGSPYPWKCATTLHHLDGELVALMGESGCVRISVGVETLDPEGLGSLPRIKRKEAAYLEEVADWCTAANVELNCFVIVGLPGTTVQAADATINRVLKLGARVRPTIYAPNEMLHPDLSLHEMALHNRQILHPSVITDPEERLRAYGLLFNRQDQATAVPYRIPRVAAPMGTRPE